MVPSPWVQVPFRQPEIDKVDNIALLAMPYQEILGLNVSMNEAHFVHGFHSVNALEHYHANCFDRKSRKIGCLGLLAVTIFQELLKVCSEDVHDHDVEVAFGPVVVNLRETHLSFE